MPFSLFHPIYPSLRCQLITGVNIPLRRPPRYSFYNDQSEATCKMSKKSNKNIAVSGQHSRIPSCSRILIVGTKPHHSKKPRLGKLRLPKLLVPTQKYCTTTLQEFFPCQTTWKMNMEDEDSLRYEFFILVSTQQHF